MNLNIVHVPNILTLVRLVLSPLVLPVLCVYLLPYNVFWVNCCLSSLFIVFSLTDFFDGFLARQYDQVSSLGRILDPIADKFLVYSTLIALLAINKIFFVWVLILIGREFFILSLRQIALEHNFSISVSWLAKCKTFVQVMYLAVLIANPFHTLSRVEFSRCMCDVYKAPLWTSIEVILLVFSLLTSVVSALYYYKSFITSYMHKAE
jgi:CDP-diacylglycerol--glycerol-3-phosphate 3-phosphatidyltransferase